MRSSPFFKNVRTTEYNLLEGANEEHGTKHMLHEPRCQGSETAGPTASEISISGIVESWLAFVLSTIVFEILLIFS